MAEESTSSTFVDTPRPAESESKRVVEEEDWKSLSLLPGGFGERRAEIWPRLLHVHPVSELQKEEEKEEEAKKHPDEHQIGLDTDRSFVLYPQDVRKDKETLQKDLHELLLALFRKRPRLSYFQGYHDIVTVLFLTLPPELQLPTAEKLSLHRVRDSMGAGLEPILGLMRVLQKLLRLADPEYASLLEQSTPLPYFALSNLLTLFSHDMPTLPLIQHVFDYLLCRPPIAVVYLAAALTLLRKPEVLRLEEDGEDGMLHSLLTSLPPIVDEEEGQESVKREDEETLVDFRIEEEDVMPTVKNELVELGMLGLDVKEEDTHLQSEVKSGAAEEEKEEHARRETSSEQTFNDEIRSTEEQHPKTSEDTGEPAGDVPSSSTETSRTEEAPSEEGLAASQLSIDEQPAASSSRSSSPAPPHRHPKAPPLSLPSLLRASDALFEQYPPTHPSLALSSIMGPQSVVFTWSASAHELPSDDIAEKMVDHPELVVYPYTEGGEDDKEDVKREPVRKKPVLTKKQSRQGVVVGAVVILGVAMIIAYSVSSDGHGGGWRKFGGWAGGAMVGVAEKFGEFTGGGEL